MNLIKFRSGVLAVSLTAALDLVAADNKKPEAEPARPAASRANDLFPDPVVAKVNGTEIKRSQVDESFIAFKANLAAQGQVIPEAQRKELEARLLDRLVVSQLLLGRATDADKTKGNELAGKVFNDYKKRAISEEAFKAQIKTLGLSLDQFKSRVTEQSICEQVLDREVRAKVAISEEQARKFYDENPDQFQQVEKVRASHIVILTQELRTGQELTGEQKKQKKELAGKILKRARDGEDFAKLAKEFSEDPGSRDNGGEYTFPRGQMVPEFEAAAFSLATNQISDIVTTKYGFHIIKVHEKIPAKKEALADINGKIKDYLAQQETQRQLPEFFARLKKEAKIQILDESLVWKEGEEKDKPKKQDR